MKIQQYQVVIVNLDPTKGSEIKKTRPCVVISPDEMNKYLKTVTIAPITSKSKSYPTRIEFSLKGQKSWIIIDQIRTIDKVRIHKKAAILSNNEMKKIKAVIKETFVD